ncbi:MAG TPA: HAMP domain-containing protein, partial [Bdellovibrionota bacterium]|nr:HAMP domain-containing protein [Bdellovibrionota bacterium]
MRSFEQKSSIIRRLTVLAFGLFAFFLFDFAATYWTSHQLVKGLQSIHELNRVFELTTLADDDITAAADSLRGAPTAVNTREVASVFSVNQQHAIGRLRALVTLETYDPEGQQLVRDALAAVGALERNAGELFRDLRLPSAKRRLTESQSDLVVLNQFELDAKDALRKLQLRIKRQSDDEFNRVYRTRNYPQLAILLGLMVLFVAGIQGVPLVRNLGRGMRNLLGATDVVATGNLTYEAPILRPDELGRLTHAFNRMVANLRDQESRAREAAEDERRRLEFLVTSSDLLTRSMDIGTTLEGAAQGPVPYLADWCVIDLLREEGRIERVSGAHADPAHDLTLKTMLNEPDRIAVTDNPVTRVLKSGKPEIVSEMTEERLSKGTASNPDRLLTYRTFGLRSYMSV